MSVKLRKLLGTGLGDGGGLLTALFAPASTASAFGDEQKTLVPTNFVVEVDFCSQAFVARAGEDMMIRLLSKQITCEIIDKVMTI